MSTFISAPNHIDLFTTSITSAEFYDAACATIVLENVKVIKHQVTGFPTGSSMDIKFSVSQDDASVLTMLRTFVTNKKVEYVEVVLEDDSIDTFVKGATVAKLITFICADGLIGDDVKTVAGCGYLSEMTNSERASGVVSSYEFAIKVIKDYTLTIAAAKFDTDVWTTPGGDFVIACGIYGCIDMLTAA